MPREGIRYYCTTALYIIWLISPKTIVLYIHNLMVFNMERKLREISGSYVITIPKQVCDLYNFSPGDNFSIEPIGNNELRIRKIQ